jgi:hypothetical protein
MVGTMLWPIPYDLSNVPFYCFHSSHVFPTFCAICVLKCSFMLFSQLSSAPPLGKHTHMRTSPTTKTQVATKCEVILLLFLSVLVRSKRVFFFNPST